MTIKDFLPKFIKQIIADKPKHKVTADYWNELFNLLIAQGDWGQEAIKLIMDKLNSDILFKSNVDAWVPETNFQPATRKFVTDQISYMGGGNMLKSIYDINNTGIVDNSQKLGNQVPAYYATNQALTDLLNAYNAYVSANNNAHYSFNNGITQLQADINRFKLVEQYPMKVITFGSAKAIRTGGNYTLATIPLERIYNYATIEFQVVHYNSSGTAQTDECAFVYLRNYVITPGFLQNGQYNEIDGNTIPGYTGRVKQIGNVSVVYNGWSSAPEGLGIEQVNGNLLVKVFDEVAGANKSYNVIGKIW